MSTMIEAGSYGLAALAYGLLSTLVLLSSRFGSRRGRLLLLAAGMTGLWALVHASDPYLDAAWAPVTASVLEVGRFGAWFMFVAALAQARDVRGSADTTPQAGDGRRWTSWNVMAVLGTVAATFGVWLLGPYGAPFTPAAGYGLLLVAALLGMLMVEQFFRRTEPNQRWGIKHLCLGLGLVMAYDFYLFADGLLFRTLSMHNWVARGVVNALVVPLLAVSAARNPTWDVNIGLSRRFVADSLVLIGGGVYLLVMALAGYYVRIVGGAWGGVLQVAFLFGAVAVFLVALFSTSLRAKARVLISKHFFSYKYDYRDEWLRFISTLSSETMDESLRERAIRAIAQIVNSPSGLLWTRSEAGNYVLTGTWNKSVPGTMTELGGSAFVDFLARTHWIIDVPEARRAAPGDRYPSLPEWLCNMESAWLVVPLVYTSRLEGFVVLDDSMVARQINWEDRDLLKTAGREVAAFVALLDANEALIDARQFDAFNRLSAFVVHDLKNILGQLSLISRNAEQHRDNPEFVDDAFKAVRSAENRMRRVLDGLSKNEMTQSQPECVRLEDVLDEVVRHCAAREPAPRLERCPHGVYVRGSHAGLVTNIEHLVRNAQEATPPEGEVAISLDRDETYALVTIADTGSGMEENFVRERLFRPFSTTKGNAGMGVGVFEVRQYIESLGGIVRVWTKPGEGTAFTLCLPLMPNDGGRPAIAPSGGSLGVAE